MSLFNRKPGKFALGFLFFTVLMDIIGLGIIIPVMPTLLTELTGKSVSEAAPYGGALLFVYAVMQFFMSPILGGISDRFGRRPVILFSLLGYSLDFAMMALAPTYWWLFLGRAMSGAFAATYATANAYIADISPPEKRAANFGLVGAAFGVGYVTQNLSASVHGGIEETRRVAGDQFSNWFATASLGAELPVGERIALVAGGAFDLRRYEAPDPLFLTERSDERLDLQGGIKLALTGSIFLQPRVTYTRNWSNIAIYDYDRWTASAGLRFEF